MTEIQNRLEHLNFEFVSCFEFRASDLYVMQAGVLDEAKMMDPVKSLSLSSQKKPSNLGVLQKGVAAVGHGQLT
jgi:hypothetical protein